MIMDPLDKLDDIKQLERLFTNNPKALLRIYNQKAPVFLGELFCRDCGIYQRMEIRVTYLPCSETVDRASFESMTRNNPAGAIHASQTKFILGQPLMPQVVPALMMYKCPRCKHESTAVIFRGPDGPDVAVFATTYGGLSTAHTPKRVAQCLDEAHRTKTVSAYAATLAMYRAALDAILSEQRYTKPTCGAKIIQLEADIKAGKGRPWTKHIDPDMLKAMKKLADKLLHCDDDCVPDWNVLNSDHVATVEGILAVLLDRVYESGPREEKGRKAIQAILDTAKP